MSRVFSSSLLIPPPCLLTAPPPHPSPTLLPLPLHHDGSILSPAMRLVQVVVLGLLVGTGKLLRGWDIENTESPAKQANSIPHLRTAIFAQDVKIHANVTINYISPASRSLPSPVATIENDKLVSESLVDLHDPERICSS